MALAQHRAGTATGLRKSSNLRNGVKPFTSSRRAPKVVRAAEEEAAPEAAEAPAAAVDTDSFAFDIKTARKNNSYEASDVQAALEYYSNGAGDMPYEADFAVNRFGTEDAAFFDDIDDNEGYAASEYLSVGIEEAAPKTKQRSKDDDEAFEEAVEEFDQERAASAAFEGVEVLDDGLLDEADGDDAPWSWDDGAAARTPAAAAAADDGEDAILAALAAIDFDALKDEDAEQRELASMVVDALGDDLDLVAAGDDGAEVPEPQGLGATEEANLAAILAIDPETACAVPQMNAEAAAAIAELAAAPAATSAALPAADVSEYLAQLRAIDTSAFGGSGALPEGVRREAVNTPSSLPPAAPAITISEIPAALLAKDAPFEVTADTAGADEGDALAAAFAAELAELEAIPVADYDAPLGSAALFPEDADLEAYEAVVDATSEYMAAAGEELTSELYLDESAEDDAAINPYDDLDGSLVARGPLVELDEDDDANFQERILELTRVTKVVKGGKIMGFRAVVVVGDGAGRVGVGCQSGREVATAVKRSLVDAKKNLVRIPLVGAGTLPHKSEAWFKAAGVVVVPASEGTGVIAGGAVRSVLELAGVQNVLAKRLGSRSVLNNARVTIKALEQLRTLSDVAQARGLPLQALLQ